MSEGFKHKFRRGISEFSEEEVSEEVAVGVREGKVAGVEAGDRGVCEFLINLRPVSKVDLEFKGGLDLDTGVDIEDLGVFEVDVSDVMFNLRPVMVDVLKGIEESRLDLSTEVSNVGSSVLDIDSIISASLSLKPLSDLGKFEEIIRSSELRLSTEVPNLAGLKDLKVCYDVLSSLKPISSVESVVKHDLILNTDVGEDLLVGSLIASAGLSLGADIGFIEFLFNVEGARSWLGLPRSFGCWGSDVPVFVVVEYGGDGGGSSRWFLVFAYLIRELLHEVTQCSRVRVIVRSPPLESSGYEEESLDVATSYSMRPLDLRCRVEVLDYRGESLHYREVLELLRGRLSTLYSHGPGAIVLALTLDEEELKEVRRSLTEGDFEVPTRVFIISPNEKLRELGEVGFMKILLGIKNIKCDSINSCIRTYKEILDHTVNTLSILVKRQVSKEGEQIDYWQYPLKVATYAAIAKDILREKLRGEGMKLEDVEKLSRLELLKLLTEKVGKTINTEKPLEISKDKVVIPDLRIKERKIAIEVESLVGTGEPMKKIDETIEKYRGLKGEVNELWVVVKPLDALLHYRDLVERMKFYNEVNRESNKGELPKVSIKVINYVGSVVGGKYNALMWELTDLREYVSKSLKDGLREYEEKVLRM